MTYDELKEAYDEKWIFLVNCELTPYSELLSGIPAVIGDRPYEGAQDGIYDQFDTEEFAPRCDATFKLTPVTFRVSLPQLIKAVPCNEDNSLTGIQTY